MFAIVRPRTSASHIRSPGSPWCKSRGIRRALHPGGRRCASFKYGRYSRSARLGRRGSPTRLPRWGPRAHRSSRCHARLAPRAARFTGSPLAGDALFCGNGTADACDDPHQGAFDARRFHPRCHLWHSSGASQPRLHDCRRAHAGGGDWRHHRDVHRRRCHSLPAAAVRRTGPAGEGVGTVFTQSNRQHGAGRFHRRQSADASLRARGCRRRDEFPGRRRRGGTRGERGPGHVGLVVHPGRGPGPRSWIPAGGIPAVARRCRDPDASVLAASLCRQPGCDRP